MAAQCSRRDVIRFLDTNKLNFGDYHHNHFIKIALINAAFSTTEITEFKVIANFEADSETLTHL